MPIDPNDPRLEGYTPLQDFIDQDQDQTSRRIRDMPFGKHKEELQISVGSLAFGNARLNVESSSQVVVLTNSGYGDLNIYGHTVKGPFLLKSAVPEKILPGETATIQVVFKPTILGAAAGNIFFDTGNASGDEYVGLTGTGIVASADLPLPTGAGVPPVGALPGSIWVDTSAGNVLKMVTA
jgi:hypothetical protein